VLHKWSAAVPFSYAEYPGNGSTKTFSVPFPYLLKAHVKLYTGFNILDGSFESQLTAGTDFTWPSDTQVKTTTAPANGVTLTILRDTPDSALLVPWQDGSNLIADDLQTAALQNLYVVQEQQDRNEAVAIQQIATTATANATAAAVANVLLYDTVPNVAAIPAAPVDGARVEILNSTGIESFTPLTGMPSGFVGSSQLKVRLTYNGTGATWAWVDYVASDPDSRYLRFLQAGAGAAQRPIQDKLREAISLKDFGAVGNGVAFDDAAVAAWLTFVINTGGAGYVPTGTYRLSQQLVIDLAAARATGVRIYGDGPRRSIFNSTHNTSTPFRVTNTNTLKNYFYSSFADIGFQGFYNGTLFQLGDDTCEGNGVIWRNITINNGLNGAAGKGLVITKFFASTFDNVTVNCGGGGTAATTVGVELNEVAFCNFNSMAIGQCRNGLVFGTGSSGYIFGNTFDNIDVEECILPVEIASTFATRNTFIGGTFVSTFGTHCVNATAGALNTFLNTNYAGPGIVSPFNNSVGVTSIVGSIVDASEYTFNVPSIRQFAYGPSATPLFQSFAASGSQQAPTSLTAQRQIASWIGHAFNGTDYRQCARVDLFSTGIPPTTTSSPGQFAVYTTPIGSTTPTLKFRIDPGGSFVPGADNAQQLGVNGGRWSSVWAVNGTIQTSDEREKTDIAPLPLGLSFIKALQPVSYKFKVGGQRIVGQEYRDADGNLVGPDDPGFDEALPGDLITESVPGRRTHWGLLAQQVKAACDQLGVDFGGWILANPDDPESQQGLRTDQFMAPVIKAVQELAAKVEEIEARLASTDLDEE
jgi:hypothetical protein